VTTDRVSSAAIDALAEMADAVQRLAAIETEGHSPDRRVFVRVSAGGRVIELRLRPDVLRHNDSQALAETLTRTVRETQLRARDAYDRAVQALVPPEVEASQEELRRIWRD
jgi:DNA-binding protein YbaB